MSTTTITFICLAVLIGGTVIAALNWDKRPQLRWSPVVAGPLSALVYIFLTPDPVTLWLAVKMVLSLAAVGLMFWFCIWIETAPWRRNNDQ